MIKFAPISEIESLLKLRGYETEVHVQSDRHSQLFRKKTSIDLECFANFRFLAKHRTYDVTLGVQSIQVRDYIGHALGRIYGRDFAAKFVDPIARPCMTMFNADALVDWPSGQMSVADSDVVAGGIERLFGRAIEPMFEAVQSYGQLLELLLQTHSPFEWWRSSVSPRIAQIVVLAHFECRDWPLVLQKIESGMALLRNDTLVDSRAKYFVNDLRDFCQMHGLKLGSAK